MWPCTTARSWKGCWTRGNTCNDVFADSAYRSAEIEAKLRVSGYNFGFIRGRRNHPLSLALSASEPRQEPDTRSHRACVRSAAERAGWSDRANDRHRAGARQDRLAEPGLQHSPPGNAGTARRGMKGSRLQYSKGSRGRKKKAVKTANQLKTGPT